MKHHSLRHAIVSLPFQVFSFCSSHTKKKRGQNSRRALRLYLWNQRTKKPNRSHFYLWTADRFHFVILTLSARCVCKWKNILFGKHRHSIIIATTTKMKFSLEMLLLLLLIIRAHGGRSQCKYKKINNLLKLNHFSFYISNMFLTTPARVTLFFTVLFF